MQNFSSSLNSMWPLATNILLGLVGLILAWRVITGQVTPMLYRKFLVIVSLIILLSFVGWQIYTFFYYQRSPIGKYFLPPHSVFYFQQINNGLVELISGVMTSAILLWLGITFVRRQKFSQFGIDDWMLLSIGTLMAGWPAVLPFLALVILLSIFGLIIQILFKKKTVNDRLIITPYIMPAAIFMVFIKLPVLSFTHLDKIRF